MKSAIETRALEIANHIRMEKGNAEDAFLEATARCRFAHSQGDFATTSLYQRAGSLIAELGGITLERIKEILPEPSKGESGDQISIPTDLRGILKNNSTGRWACDHVGIQSDGKSVQAMATDGAMLAIVDQGMLHAESLPAGETLVSKDNLPTKIRDRKATMPAVADQPEAGTAQLPPIDGIVPSSDKHTASITLNVLKLRRLLDAICEVDHKEQLVTIALQDSPTKPAVIATESAIGVIVGCHPDNSAIDKGFDDRVAAAVSLAQAAHSH